jgi:hypothetical protein
MVFMSLVHIAGGTGGGNIIGHIVFCRLSQLLQLCYSGVGQFGGRDSFVCVDQIMLLCMTQFFEAAGAPKTPAVITDDCCDQYASLPIVPCESTSMCFDGTFSYYNPIGVLHLKYSGSMTFAHRWSNYARFMARVYRACASATEFVRR